MRGELALQKKDIIAAQAKVNQIRKPTESVLPISAKQNTRETLARQAGVSGDTIHKIEKIKATADESLLTAVCNRKILTLELW